MVLWAPHTLLIAGMLHVCVSDDVVSRDEHRQIADLSVMAALTLILTPHT